MGRIRVLLACLPQMMLDLLAQALSRRPEFERVGIARDGETLGECLRQDQPDLLLRGDSGDDGDAVAHLRREYPRLSIVSLSPSGRGAVLDFAGQTLQRITDFSVDDLLDAAARSCQGADDA